MKIYNTARGRRHRRSTPWRPSCCSRPSSRSRSAGSRSAGPVAGSGSKASLGALRGPGVSAVHDDPGATDDAVRRPGAAVRTPWPGVRTPLPGPASAALLARKDAVLHGPLRDGHEHPRRPRARDGHVLRGRRRQRLRRPPQRVGASPVRRTTAVRAAATLAAWTATGWDRADTWRAARRHLAEQLVDLAPARVTRAPAVRDRDRGGRGRRQAGPGVDGPPGHPRFPRQYHGESTYLTAASSTDMPGNTSNNTQYIAGLVLVPYPNRFRAPSTAGPARTTTRSTSTTSRLGARGTRSSPTRSPASSSSRSRRGRHPRPSAAWWAGWSTWAGQHGWRLILDEVQSGLGRCGEVFAGESGGPRA